EFVMHEQIRVENISKLNENFTDFNKKTIDLLISEAKNFAIKELLPTNKEGDEQGCTIKNGVVTTPDSFKRLYKIYNEGEWLGLTGAQEWGGQGIPKSVAAGVDEYFDGANFSFMMYPGLTLCAAHLVDEFGTDEQKNIYLKKMFAGKWTGTMLLTEPGAGSDVGALTTQAVRNDDGTFSIIGDKIFISGGEQDLTENIIHPVLARIEGAPEGTKGISLFLVPKYRINADGTPGEFNDVVCTGIEHKLGLHGNSTCSLSLGSKGNCIGTLLGNENKGMKAMFQMMNGARVAVGFQGFACASTAYMYALDYARQRIQGKDLLEFMNPDAKAVPIIRHPDIKRQLMNMKVIVEGMRSLLYFVCYCEDMSSHAKTQEEKEKYQGIVEILTPLAKGYVTDRAFEVCSQAMQVYGGYGFIEEYPISQLLRDCRITMIYEGTNGIQAMDLLGRKLGLNKGKPFMDLFGEMQKAVANAKAIPSLENQATKVEKVINQLAEVAYHMGQTAMSKRVLNAFANAHPFLDAMGDVTMAWMHLWRATIAIQKLEKAKKKDKSFYEGIIKSLQFYVETQVPITLGKFAALMNTSSAAVDTENSMFPS
ncbi:MAG: acyl-CoA dehydrogenase, partial [Desulfobacula sp.]|nr:acyl-CoA dehydrogenase [Desulfobacula sp.]